MVIVKYSKGKIISYELLNNLFLPPFLSLSLSCKKIHSDKAELFPPRLHIQYECCGNVGEESMTRRTKRGAAETENFCGGLRPDSRIQIL